MSKGTCGHVLVLPSRRLVRPAADNDFVLVIRVFTVPRFWLFGANDLQLI